MNQLTIRGLEPALERHLRGVARQRGCSLNKAALHLMRRGAGLRCPEDGPEAVGDALDSFIGSWTPEQAAEIESAVAELRTIDEAFWQ